LVELDKIKQELSKIETKQELQGLINTNSHGRKEVNEFLLNQIVKQLKAPAAVVQANVDKYKSKLQGLGIATGKENANDS